MTIQTTNIDATTGDAVDLTSSGEVFFTIADNVVLESQFANGVVGESGQSSFIYNNGDIVANGDGVILENANDHFYNEPAGTVFGFRGVEMTTTGETFVDYGAVSGDVYGAEDVAGDNIISNYGMIEGPTAGLNIAAGGDTITNATTGTIGGGIAIASGGQTIINAGAIDGNITFTGIANSNGNSVTNSGEITGSITLVTGTATTIYNDGTINGVGGTAISLAGGPGNTVVLGKTSVLDGAITGFSTGDTIDLQGISANGWNYSGGILSLENGSTTVAQVILSTPFAHPDFGVAADGAGGTIIHLEPPPTDFAGNGMSDLLFQNSNGTPDIWQVNGTNLLNATPLVNPGPTWQLVGTGDFNGDGKSDLLFQNSNGTPDIWEMNGTTPTSMTALVNPGPTWHVIGTGDFNGDGKSDILFQNTDGTPDIWEMNGTTPTSMTALFNPGPAWHLIGTGDVNGDGMSDLLFQNTDGTPAIWEMNGTTPTSMTALFNPGPAWHLIGSGDFNGDGMSDLLFQNDDGTPAIWEMNGTTPTSMTALVNPGTAWHVIGTGDFNGDGKSDILFQNTDGTPAIWEMNGTNVLTMASLTNPGSSWHLIPGL